MDLQAIAETTVEMWVLIDAKLKARSQENLEPEVKAMMLDKAMSLYMTHIIHKAKSSESSKKEEDKDTEGYCNRCGRRLTDKERDWIKDHDSKEICYHCTKKEGG